MSNQNNNKNQAIAIFVNSLGGGGAEKIAVMQANGILAKGYPVDLIVERNVGSYRAMLSPEVNIIDLASTSPFTILSKLCSYFRATPPRAIICHLEKTSLLAIVAGLFTGYRKIIPVLEVNLDSYVKIDHQLRRNFLCFLLSIFYRLAPKMIAVSHGCKASLAPLVGSRKARDIVTVYNGFELEKLRTESHETITHPLLAQKNKPLFIAAGRFAAQKNFELLIRAFAEVRRTHDAGLIILGEGHLHDKLQNLINTLGLNKDVHLPGFQPNPLAWFSKCDAYIMSSDAEGLANVLIEAMISGTNLISTDCPSGPEEILNKGQYGVLVPVGDAPALAKAMQNLLDKTNPIQATQTEIQSYIDRTFSFDIMIDGYLAVVADVEAKAA